MQPYTARPTARPEPWTAVSGRIGPSLFDTLFPNAATRHRVIASAALIALIFVCAKARFYLPDNPTPITLQTLGVFLTAGIMGWRWGTAAVIGYIALGALGLPFFATAEPWAFRTPAEVWNITLTGVTGGYIIGFVLAAAIAGLLSQMGFTHSRSIWPVLLGGLLLYLPALLWLSIFDFGWPAPGKLFEQGMYVFMPGDLVKILGASLALTGIWNYGDRILDAAKRMFRNPQS